MKVTIKDVNIERVVKGKTKYSKATVAYIYNGEQRTQNIVDFANPSIFKQVQELIGQEVEVTLTKNAQNFNEWSAVEVLGNQTSAASSGFAETPKTTRVSGSNYETAEERAKKQVYIIKQSSISNAIDLYSNTGFERNESFNVEDILRTAQQFTDWVLSNEEKDSE